MLNTSTTIQHDTTKLHDQYRTISESRWNALRNVISDAYIRTTGLSLDDPPELWQFAIGQSESFLDWEPNKQFRAILERRTLRESVLSLANRIKDDGVLVKHLTKLLKLVKRRRLTKADFDFKRADRDESTRCLVMNWIQDPPGEDWAIAGLCFFSDLAMAKLVYFVANKRTKWLPPTLLTKEPERIRKTYSHLGLVPARPRIIKDIHFKAGQIHWIPYKKAIYTVEREKRKR